MENNNQEPRRNDLSRYYAWYEGQEKGTPKVGVVSSTAGRIRQSQFMDNTGGIITEQDYGRRLENRLRGNLDNLFTARQDAEQIRSFISPSIRREFDLINAGFTTSRSLGKEHDKELNRITLRRMIDGGYQNSEVLEDERRWAAYAANDADMTVQDLVSSLTAERIASDNRIIDTLKTEEELNNAGYQLSSFAVPVLEGNKGKLYDLTYATKKTLGVEKNEDGNLAFKNYESSIAPAYALTSNGSEIKIDSFSNMKHIENANAVLQSLAKSLGVKLVEDASLKAGQTSFKPSRVRGFGRRLLNGFRIRTNAKATAIEKPGVLRYSIVTSGRALQGEDIDKVYDAIETINQETNGYVCASLGLLDEEKFSKLKEAGLKRVHNNLETSRNFFPEVCTTHTYDEKINAIKAAQKAGLTVCRIKRTWYNVYTSKHVKSNSQYSF